MAKHGHLPKRLADCRVPWCTACLFGKAMKRPWRSKGAGSQSKIKVTTKPEQVVSIDRLEPPRPRLFAPLKGTACWPKAISAHLWPYALHTADYVLCACNKRADGKSALELFARSDAKAKIDIF